MTGFVGANGAGKTTTMRIGMGVLGRVGGRRCAGRSEPVTAADRRRFGYMPEERGLYPKHHVVDQLVYLGELHGVAGAGARRSDEPARAASASPTAAGTASTRSPSATSSGSRSPPR